MCLLQLLFYVSADGWFLNKLGNLVDELEVNLSDCIEILWKSVKW